MATYADKYTKSALTGKDIGIVFGKVYEGVALTGDTSAGTNKDFTFDPTKYAPFYPMNTYPDTLTASKTDVVVYDDGVAATISSFAPTTGVVTLSSAPAKDSVVTGDCCEQMELYIAQNATLTPKQETDTLDQLRNATQRQTYGNIEFTLKADFKVADLETMKLIFEETNTTGKYEFPDEPPKVCVAILIEDAGVIQAIIYCNDARASFSDILSAKAGKDAVENGFEITFGTSPIMIVPSETS